MAEGYDAEKEREAEILTYSGRSIHPDSLDDFSKKAHFPFI